MIGGSFAGFWSVVSTIRQSLNMLAIKLTTEQNSKTASFLIPIHDDLARKRTDSFPDRIKNNLTRQDSIPFSEETHAPLTPHMSWMDEDESQGGEFLDDTLRVTDQPL